MKTLDLTQQPMTVDDLLKLARSESLRILAGDGSAFVLEEADDFDKEVELLGKSEKFQRFLSDRAQEPGITTLEDYRQSLN
ncbi:MAG: hypothetical protein ACKV2Q_36300 [Planctomycetaceae bacterium]